MKDTRLKFNGISFDFPAHWSAEKQVKFLEKVLQHMDRDNVLDTLQKLSAHAPLSRVSVRILFPV